MTTAGRATFDTARGGTQRGEGNLSRLSKQYSSKDMPSHTKLKYRDQPTGKVDQLFDEMRKGLDEREQRESDRRGGRAAQRVSSASSSSASQSKRARVDAANIDADDAIDEESSDDEDDTEELMRELEKIKKEKAEEADRRDREKQIEEEKIRTENIIKSNPLIHQHGHGLGGDFKVKRRWDDDVVFKNCAKEKDKKPEFINDTLRTEFHKRFMSKYIK